MRWHRAVKYFLLFINLTFASMQGGFLYLDFFREPFSHLWIFFHAALCGFFAYTGITQFRSMSRLERHHRVTNEEIDRLMEELTNRYELRRIEHVNWKRDGF